ncbi:MAG: dCTP deaminase [Gaiellaceae bacterium]|nr:dCTP deaminase [Gaiellaceae bacterium]
MMRHDLAPGETAVVETEEVLKLPGNLAAVVFPPDAVSKEAILMTNPGHVDPGFSGPLKFTLINMGKKPHTLQQGKPVATALFFKLAASPAEDWLKRHDGVAGSGASPEMLDRLSKDFLDIEKRATAQVRSQLLKIGSLGAAITILLSALAVGGAVLPAVLWGPDASLSGRVATLQQRLDETQAELHATTAKLAVLHRAQANGPVKVKP